MKTLTLEEASYFLKIPANVIIERIESDNLPAAILGDQLLFIENDLVDYLRGHYHTLAPTVAIKSTTLFKELVPHVLRLEENRIRRGELSIKALSITRNRLVKWVLPYFGELPISEIGYLTLEKFVNELSEAELQGVAIAQYLVIVRKVLNYGLLTNLLISLPQFPRVKTPRTSRGAFIIAEYRQLLKTAWRLRDQPYQMQRGTKEVHVNGTCVMQVIMRRDMARLIGFMVNSFIRPSDLRLIQHKHVEIVDGEYRYLRLMLPESKKHDQPIVTMTAAVSIYSRLLQDAKSRGYGKPNDYLFMPELAKRRDHALRQLGFLFDWVLSKSNLKVGAKGQNRTLYSLRHTSITFRLLYGEGVDLLTLAKNARTSVIMIERHYASTLNGEMNIGLLHSKRSRKHNVIK